MAKPKRVSVRLSNSQIAKILQMAEMFDTTQSQIIRTFIHEGLLVQAKKGHIQYCAISKGWQR